MFRDCARLKRNVFVTWKENDVNEQDVDERKECWKSKRVLSHIWVKSESDLDQISTRSLTSSNQSWYTRNKNLIYIDDMKYNKFIKLIKNELNYDCVTDMMIYDWAKFARIYISNEHEWKTALKEMHAEEFIHFLFTI